ncbi:MAG TPA: cysteine rich repeat-containing protein [Rhizobiaceae bacterium]|nr:cysteine rich repeat-containing protein [Rhizobiaceae bacterium]
MAIFLATQLVPTAAFAQTAQQKAACRADYRKFCTGVMPGRGRLIKCLSKHTNDLTPDCQKVVKANSGG